MGVVARGLRGNELVCIKGSMIRGEVRGWRRFKVKGYCCVVLRGRCFKKCLLYCFGCCCCLC